MEMNYKTIQKKGHVFVRDTDATGGIFCPRPIEWVIEALEEVCFLKSSTKGVIAQAHVEFIQPLVWGDSYTLYLDIVRVGNRSLEIEGKVFNENSLAIVVRLTFVFETSSRDFVDQHWGR